jgi:L-fuculose-phosphate aldolase
MTEPNESALRQALVDAARALSAARLNCGTAGNASTRCGSGLLITPSATHPDQLTPDDIVFMSFDGHASGLRAPSSEWQLHRDLYVARPDAGAVIHTHSPFATALACQRRGIPPFHYTVARFGGDDVRCAEYALFGSAELSQTIQAAMRDRNACLMANHGAVVCADSVSAAVTLALELEFLSELYWRASQGGAPVLLDAAEMAAVGERYRGYCRSVGRNPRAEDGALANRQPRGFRHFGARRRGGQLSRRGGIRTMRPCRFHPTQSQSASELPTLDPASIYKLLTAADWRLAQADGSFRGSSDDERDGYIHLSSAAQVAGTLAKYFAQTHDLILLAVDPAELGDALRFEPSRGGDSFPHLYAPLPLAATRMSAHRITPDAAWQLLDA